VSPLAVFTRVADVLWRTAGDSVLLHRIHATPDTAAFQLSGRAACIWVALDEPGTIDDIVARLVDADLAAPDLVGLAEDCALLINLGVIETIEHADA
jgi:hypothetical protein